MTLNYHSYSSKNATKSQIEKGTEPIVAKDSTLINKQSQNGQIFSKFYFVSNNLPELNSMLSRLLQKPSYRYPSPFLCSCTCKNQSDSVRQAFSGKK